MKPQPVVEEIPLQALLSLMREHPEPAMTDKDFLEQLAARRCFLVPPWILRAKPEGGLERIALITFNRHLNVDKTQTLATVRKTINDAETTPTQERARGQARHAG